MSAQSLDGTHDPNDHVHDWFVRLGLDNPAECATDLAQGMVDDPFRVIGFTSIAGFYFGDGFYEVVDWLAEHEPSLRTGLPAVAATMPSLAANDQLPRLDEPECAALPRWLREIDKLECSGVMRRFDYADRSASSYLIEVRFTDQQVATGRLSIRHGDVDVVSEFWTTQLSLREAAAFYRKRRARLSTRAYRHIKPETAGRRILDAMAGSVSSGAIFEDIRAPIPWPRNLPVLNLMLQPALALITDPICDV